MGPKLHLHDDVRQLSPLVRAAVDPLAVALADKACIFSNLLQSDGWGAFERWRVRPVECQMPFAVKLSEEAGNFLCARLWEWRDAGVVPGRCIITLRTLHLHHLPSRAAVALALGLIRGDVGAGR